MPSRKSVTFFPNVLALCCIFALAHPEIALAQTKAQSVQVLTYDIKAGSLDSALNQFSTQSKLQVVFSPELTAGKKTSGLSGQHSPQVALKKLLEGTGLTWDAVNESMYVLKKAQVPVRQSRDTTGTKSTANVTVSQRENQEVQELEKMVVVGSRLGVSPVDSAMPIQVITREQIDRSGSGNIAQVLSYLSEVSVNNSGDRPIGVGDGLQAGGNTNSTTVQMRGMPRGTTLILINGRRAGESATYSDTGQFDLSTIPLSLVERIEVLPAGSSAIYGGDGLAGVINVVLRRDANGLEMRYRQSHADSYTTRQASIMWGKTWSRGDLTIAANWGEEGSLYSAERSLTANQDYTRFGGQDWRTDSSNPGTVYSLDGCRPAPRSCGLDLALRGNLPGLSSPVAVIPSGSNGIGLQPSDFLETQGQINQTSFQRHLRSAEEKFGVTMNGRVTLGGSVEGFAELSYTKRSVPAYEVGLATTFAINGTRYSRVPATNPFNPFGVDVAVGFNFVNTGIFTSYDEDYARGALGLSGKQKHFDWEISGWQSQNETSTHGATYFDAARVLAAINSTDPATALNPFVSNGDAPGSPELMHSLIGGSILSTSKSKTTGVTGYIRGQPLKLPAGSVTALVGAEHLRQSFSSETNNPASTIQHSDGATSSTAYFAEARVPVIAPSEGTSSDRLALTGALRRETSSRFERDAATEMIGLELRPTETLLLRSTYSTAFRPLLNYYAILDPSFRTQTISDPMFGGAEYQVRVRQRGGSPEDLNPESSKNSTIGLVYRPTSTWSLSLTHWDMEFTDQISFIAIQDLVDQEALRPGRVIRDTETGLIDEVDGRQVNIALTSAAGVDIGIDGSWNTAFGDFQAYLTATYTYEHEQKATKESPVENGLGQLNSIGWAPRWKIVPRISWDQGPVRAMLTGRYVSAYRDSLPFQSGPRTGEVHMLGDFWMFDLNFDISVGKYFPESSMFSGSNVNIGATNIFNRLPDNCFGCYDVGYDASQYDIIGRSVYAELRLNF